MPKRPGSPLEPSGVSKITKFFNAKSARSSAKGEESLATGSTKGTSAAPILLDEDEDVAASNEEDDDDLPTEPLEQLLSLEGLGTLEELDARFEVIARTLFTKYHLRVERPSKNEVKKTVASKLEKLPTDADATDTNADVEAVDPVAKEKLKTKAIETDHTDLQILEMEFYLIIPGLHEDPFCHGSVEQKGSGWWYFHRAPTRSASSTHTPSAAGAYRDGSRKGMDLTFGTIIPNRQTQTQTIAKIDNPSKDKSGPSSGSVAAVGKPRGGILLRSVRVVKTGVIVSGPSLLVDLILTLSGADRIETLVQDHWNGDISAFRSPQDVFDSSQNSSRLSIIPVRTGSNSSAFTSKTPKLKYYRTPRIGLDLSHYTATADVNNPRVIFVQKNYRFVREPHLLKANGRSQTFAGLLFHLLRAGGVSAVFPLKGRERERIISSIITVGGFTAASARTYLGHFERGVEKGFSTVKSFCGSTGKGVCQSPEKLLTMLGALYSAGQSK